MLENGRPTDWYQPFLGQVVLPHASLFASLVTAGEAFLALSLLFGLATRLGAGVAMFLTLNYSLLYGQSFLTPSGNTLDFWVSFRLLGGLPVASGGRLLPATALAASADLVGGPGSVRLV